MTAERILLDSLYKHPHQTAEELHTSVHGELPGVTVVDIKEWLQAEDGNFVGWEARGDITWHLRPRGQDRLAELDTD